MRRVPRKPLSGAAVVLIVLGVLAAIAFGGCGICVIVAAMRMPADAGAVTVTPVAPDARQKEHPVVVDLGALIAEYNADAGAADARYLGTYVRVAGIVTATDIHGIAILKERSTLKPKAVQALDSDSVRCRFKDWSSMPDFKLGERASLTGYVAAGGEMGVILEDCSKD
jgi:hypothetical protein